MAGRPPPGARFEVSSISQGRRRRPLAPVVWSGLLVALIALAIVGRTTSAPGGPASVVPSAGGDAANLGSLVPAPGDPFFRSPFFGGGPPELDSTIRVDTSSGDSEANPDQPPARRLWISGNVFVRAELIIVTIQSPIGRVIGSRTITVSLDGAIRPAESPRLDLSFDLPARVTDGRVLVEIMALDSTGLVVGELHRNLGIGAATQTWLRRPLHLMS
jgi:hypothetical protein